MKRILWSRFLRLDQVQFCDVHKVHERTPTPFRLAFLKDNLLLGAVVLGRVVRVVVEPYQSPTPYWVPSRRDFFFCVGFKSH